MSANVKISNWLRGLVGGVAGGAVGYFAFFLIARQGFYAIALPGALVGLGCGMLSGVKSNTLGIACGLAALVLGIYTEWRFAPFMDDDRFAFFVAHVHQLQPVKLIMIALGGVIGFWFGRGRGGGDVPRRGDDTSSG